MPLINHAGGGGGTPQLCSQVENFKVIPGSTALSARLSWEAPTVDEDSSFVGVRIVRKAGSVPEKVSDGTVVYEGTALTYTDTGLTAGTTYYYRAFAYNAKKKYQTARRVVSLTATTITLGATLNDCTWAQIQAISNMGIASSTWSVGDTKSVTLAKLYEGNALVCDAFVIGFNHNSNYEGANRIHFKFGKQNGKQIGFYAWVLNGSSAIDISTVQSAMPKELQNVLKSTTKYSYDGSSVVSSSEKICAIGSVESFGSVSGAYSALQGKQQQYEYYKAGNSLRHWLNNDQYINYSTGAQYTGNVRTRDNAWEGHYIEIDKNGDYRTTDAKYADVSAPIFFV